MESLCKLNKISTERSKKKKKKSPGNQACYQEHLNKVGFSFPDINGRIVLFFIMLNIRGFI